MRDHQGMVRERPVRVVELYGGGERYRKLPFYLWNRLGCENTVVRTVGTSLVVDICQWAREVHYTDNGKEFSGSMVQDFCQANGIQMEFTAPYSPSQNGVAERLN